MWGRICDGSSIGYGLIGGGSLLVVVLRVIGRGVGKSVGKRMAVSG